MSNHRHRPSRVKGYMPHIRGYNYPVAYPENPKAHGNTTQTDICSCGAKRLRNINGRHTETGEWFHEED